MSRLHWMLLLLTALASAASAQEKLFVVVPAVNGALNPGSGRTSSECLLEEIVANDAFKAVTAKVPDTVKIKNPADAGDGKALLITIVDIIGWGGGGWTGSKRLVLRAELMQGKRVLQTRNVNERSRGGVLGPVMGTCAIFEDISSAAAQRIATWVVTARNRSGPTLNPEAPAEAKPEPEPKAAPQPLADPDKK